MSIAAWADLGRMDELGRLDTPVHRLDARAKALATLAFVVTVMSFPRHEIAALTPFALYPVLLMAAGRIPAGVIGRKLLVASPFAVMVGIFNPLLDRDPMMLLGGWEISGGWVSFASLLIRFALTVSAALALVACTGMYRLGHGLERLGAPRVFVVQLLFLYRYLFVITETAMAMVRSVTLRAPGRRALTLGVFGSLTGHLLLRSLDRAERVYRSMVARGFDGEILLLHRTGFGWREGVFLAGCIAAFAAARVWNLAAAIGRIGTGAGP